MKSRFSEEQIINILKEADAGIKVADLCRKHNISSPTYSLGRQNLEVWMFQRQEDYAA